MNFTQTGISRQLNSLTSKSTKIRSACLEMFCVYRQTDGWTKQIS